MDEIIINDEVAPISIPKFQSHLEQSQELGPPYRFGSDSPSTITTTRVKVVSLPPGVRPPSNKLKYKFSPKPPYGNRPDYGSSSSGQLYPHHLGGTASKWGNSNNNLYQTKSDVTRRPSPTTTQSSTKGQFPVRGRPSSSSIQEEVDQRPLKSVDKDETVDIEGNNATTVITIVTANDTSPSNETKITIVEAEHVLNANASSQSESGNSTIGVKKHLLSDEQLSIVKIVKKKTSNDSTEDSGDGKEIDENRERDPNANYMILHKVRYTLH